MINQRISLDDYRKLAAKDGRKRRGQRRRCNRPEETLQRMCIQWANTHLERYPDLAYLFHPANGGFRTPAEAGILKAMGVRTGVPDLLLPLASPDGRFQGMALELKSPAGRLTEAQKRWLDRLAQSGYLTAVVRSLDDFIACVQAWHGGSRMRVPR